MEDRAYGCVLTVLIGLHHIVRILVLYQLHSWCFCRVVDFSVAVRWMSLEAVGVRLRGVLDNWQSVAFPHTALLRS